MMMLVRISENDSLRLKFVATSPAPLDMNVIRKLVKIMPNGLNFAIHATRTAVKPRPFARVVVMV